MSHIYHIATAAAWRAAQQRGIYTAPSLDAEGFIHCSAREQVTLVANAIYRDLDDLLLLCIDPEKLGAAVRWETPAPPAGQDGPAPDALFPHVYGPIDLRAVTRVLPLHRAENGDYRLPDELAASD